MIDKCCGTCKHHKYTDDVKDWWCGEVESDYYTDFTPYEFGEDCSQWEGRDK